MHQFESQQYRESQMSRWFPGDNLKTLILQYCDRAWQIGSSVALREFEQALRSL